MLEIANLIDERVTSHTTSRCLIVCTVVCAYPGISVHKSEKPSKLCLSGSHYLSSFRELSKSIWVVLFQNFREPATVASFENIRSEVLKSKVHLLKCVHRSNSSRKFINASCIVYVVSGVTHFDFSRGYRNNFLKNNEKPKKNCEFCTAFLKTMFHSCINFLSAHNCASVFSLALYRQIFLVYLESIMMARSLRDCKI